MSAPRRSWRSQQVLLSSLAFAATVPLAGCGKPKAPEAIYETPEACAINNDDGQCESAYLAAQRSWSRLPGYQTDMDCKLGTGGNCARRPDGSFEAPMVGFLMAGQRPVTYQRNRDCDRTDQPRDPNSCPSTSVGGHGFGVSHAYYANGAYLRPSDSLRTGLATVSSETSIHTTRVAAQARADAEARASAGRGAVSRGGFGESAAGHGGGGGE